MQRTYWRGAANVLVVGVVVVGAVAAVFGAMWYGVSRTAAEDREKSERLAAVITGSDQPLPKTLDARFKDADGDLVADAPSDPAKLVNPDTLVFSFVSENPEESKAAWKEFTDYLAKATGKKVEYLLAPNAEEQVRAIADGKLHVAGLGTGSVPMAVNLAGFVPAFTLGTKEAGGYIHMEIIVPADSSLQKPEDLRGHTLAFVDLNSNSGFKAPMVILKTKFNLLPEKDYTMVYSFGQERSIAGIADKTYDAAAVASDVLVRAVASKKIAANQYRTIYSSEEFPAVTLGYAYNLAPELVGKIKSAFATFDFKGTALAERFAASKQDHFQPVNYKNDFAQVRFIDDQVGKPYVLH